MEVNLQANFDTETEVMGEIRCTLQATVDSVNGTPTTHAMLDETFTGSGGNEDGIMLAYGKEPSKLSRRSARPLS
jgi:hypothetical protein